MSNFNELLNNPNIANNKNLTKEIVACFSDYSKEAPKIALGQSQLNATQIKAVLVSKGLQGGLLKTTTAELANTTATNAMAAADGTATTATGKFSLALKGLGTSLKTLVLTHPILTTIALVGTGIALYTQFGDTLENLQEKAQKSKED